MSQYLLQFKSQQYKLRLIMSEISGEPGRFGRIVNAFKNTLGIPTKPPETPAHKPDESQADKVDRYSALPSLDESEAATKRLRDWERDKKAQASDSEIRLREARMKDSNDPLTPGRADANGRT